MNDVLLINEEFFKKNVSHNQSFDTNQVISSIRLVQKTNLASIVTEKVYNHFQDILRNASPFQPSEEKLFESMQLFLAVKVAEELVYASPSDDYKSSSHISYRNKATLLEARIVRDINRDATLLSLARSDENEFDDAEMDIQGGFYFG